MLRYSKLSFLSLGLFVLLYIIFFSLGESLFYKPFLPSHVSDKLSYSMFSLNILLIQSLSILCALGLVLVLESGWISFKERLRRGRRKLNRCFPELLKTALRSFLIAVLLCVFLALFAKKLSWIELGFGNLSLSSLWLLLPIFYQFFLFVLWFLSLELARQFIVRSLSQALLSCLLIVVFEAQVLYLYVLGLQANPSDAFLFSLLWSFSSALLFFRQGHSLFPAVLRLSWLAGVAFSLVHLLGMPIFEWRGASIYSLYRGAEFPWEQGLPVAALFFIGSALVPFLSKRLTHSF